MLFYYCCCCHHHRYCDLPRSLQKCICWVTWEGRNTSKPCRTTIPVLLCPRRKLWVFFFFTCGWFKVTGSHEKCEITGMAGRGRKGGRNYLEFDLLWGRNSSVDGVIILSLSWPMFWGWFCIFPWFFYAAQASGFVCLLLCFLFFRSMVFLSISVLSVISFWRHVVFVSCVYFHCSCPSFYLCSCLCSVSIAVLFCYLSLFGVMFALFLSLYLSVPLLEGFSTPFTRPAR